MSVIKSIDGQTVENFKTLREIKDCMQMQLKFLKDVEKDLQAEADCRGESFEKPWRLGAAQEMCRDMLGMLGTLFSTMR